MSVHESVRLGDWQLEQEIDEFSAAMVEELALSIKSIARRAIKRHERTLVKRGLLMENEKQEITKESEKIENA